MDQEALITQLQQQLSTMQQQMASVHSCPNCKPAGPDKTSKPRDVKKRLRYQHQNPLTVKGKVEDIPEAM